MIAEFEFRIWESFRPCPGSPKILFLSREGHTGCEIPEIPLAVFPRRFLIQDNRKTFPGNNWKEAAPDFFTEEVRSFGGKFYHPFRRTFGGAVSRDTGLIPDLKEYLEKLYALRHDTLIDSGSQFTEFSTIIGSNAEDAADYFSEKCGHYLICDGTLWQVCLEPCYRIETVLLRKQKYTRFFVSLTGPCHSRYCRTFPANEYSRAVNSFRKESLNRSTLAVFSPSTRIIPVNHLALVRNSAQENTQTDTNLRVLA